MGCGKGMILFRVASEPYVVEYAGADLAKQARGARLASHAPPTRA